MNDRSLFPALSLVLMTAGLVYAYHERDLLAATEPAVSRPAGEPPSQIAEVAPPAQLRSSGNPPIPQTSTLETAAPASVPSNPAAAEKGLPGQMFSQFATHPDFELAYFESHRAAIPHHYRSFLAQFGATEEQVRKFGDIMMKRAEEWVDIQTAVQVSEQTIAKDDVVKLDRISRMARDEALRALLGPTAPDLLQQHKNTHTQREFVSSFATPAFAAGQPLSQSQFEQLVQLITVTNVGMSGGTNFETFFHHSAAILTPAQLDLLRAASAPLRQRASLH